MATQETIIEKLEQLQDLIDEIPAEAFRAPRVADFLKGKLKHRVDNAIALVSNGSPNALNTATFILTWRVRRPLDANKRFSWVKEPLPIILRLIDAIISDIESLFTNTPPVAVIKIDGVDVGQYFGAPVNVALEFDASFSWDEDGEIVGYEWVFGDATPLSNEMTVSHTYLMAGTYRIVLTVTDNGSPAETSTDWVEITVM